MEQSRFENFGNFIEATSHNNKRIMVLLTLLLVFVVSITTTLAVFLNSNNTLNAAWDVDGRIEVMLQKFELDEDENLTDKPVSEARFALFAIHEGGTCSAENLEDELDEGTCERIEIDNKNTFYTDKDGRIVVMLPPGDYVFLELDPPRGFTFATDDDGEPIYRWYFTLNEDGEVEGEGIFGPFEDNIIIAFNIARTGYVLVVENQIHIRINNEDVNLTDLIGMTDAELADEFELTPEEIGPLRAQIEEFSKDDFHVDFIAGFFEGHELEHEVDIYEYNIISGEWEFVGPAVIFEDTTLPGFPGFVFSLRHNQRAHVLNLPYRIRYNVQEIPMSGFTTESEYTPTGLIGVMEWCRRDPDDRSVWICPPVEPDYNFAIFRNIYTGSGMGSFRVNKTVRNLVDPDLTLPQSNQLFEFTVRIYDDMGDVTDEPYKIDDEDLSNPDVSDADNNDDYVDGLNIYSYSNIYDEDNDIYDEASDDNDITMFSLYDSYEGNENDVECEYFAGGTQCTFSLRHGEYQWFRNVPAGSRITVTENLASTFGLGFVSNTITTTRYVLPDDELHIDFFTYHGDVDGYGDLEISKTIIAHEGQEIDSEQIFDFELVLTGFDPSGEGVEVYFNDDVDHTTIYGPIHTEAFQLADGETFRIRDLPHGVRYNVIGEDVPEFIQKTISQQGIIIADEETSVQFYSDMYFEDDLTGLTNLEVCMDITNDGPYIVPSESYIPFILRWWDPSNPVATRNEYEFSLRSTHCELIERLPIGYSFLIVESHELWTGRHDISGSPGTVGTLVENQPLAEFLFRDTYVDIPVVKSWNNMLNDVAVPLPESITVRLWEAGVTPEVRSMELEPDENDDWRGIFTAPRNRGGTPIIYTIDEVPILGWDFDVSEEMICAETEHSWQRNCHRAITNTAIELPTEEIQVHKQITGATPSIPQQFEFILRAVTPGAPMPSSDSVFINGAGTVAFPPIMFNESGTFVYTVHEVIPADQGDYFFDTAVYNITIIVEEDVNGELIITERLLGRNGVVLTEFDFEFDILFRNHYNGISDLDPDPTEPIEPDPDPIDPDPTEPADPIDPDPDPIVPGEQGPPGEPGPPGEQGPPGEPGPPPQSRPPQTGDDTPLGLWIMLTALSGVSLVLYTLRSYVKHKDEYLR